MHCTQKFQTRADLGFREMITQSYPLCRLIVCFHFLGFVPNSCSFAPTKVFLGPENAILRQKLSDRYGIPAWFWNDLYLLANGFSGSEDIYDERGNAKDHSTCPIHFLEPADPNWRTRYLVPILDQETHPRRAPSGPYL